MIWSFSVCARSAFPLYRTVPAWTEGTRRREIPLRPVIDLRMLAALFPFREHVPRAVLFSPLGEQPSQGVGRETRHTFSSQLKQN